MENVLRLERLTIVTLDLTIYSSTSGTDIQSECGTYSWIDGMTYTATTNTPTYTIVGGNANGCDSIVTLDLTIYSSTSGTDIQTACGTYSWIDGMTYTATTNTPTYTIVGGNVNGCDSIVTLDLAIYSSTSGTDMQTACGTYSWIDGMTYTAITNTPTYTIVGGNVNGCDSIVTLGLTIDPNPDTTLTLIGGVATANQAGATYQWLDCDNGNQPIPGETNQSFTPATAGFFAVEITLGDCAGTSACTAIVLSNSHESNAEAPFSVYPNPSNGLITVEFDRPQEGTTIRVADLSGKVVAMFFMENESNIHLALDGSANIYMLEIETSNGIVTTKKILLYK